MSTTQGSSCSGASEVDHAGSEQKASPSTDAVPANELNDVAVPDISQLPGAHCTYIAHACSPGKGYNELRTRVTLVFSRM